MTKLAVYVEIMKGKVGDMIYFMYVTTFFSSLK